MIGMGEGERDPSDDRGELKFDDPLLDGEDGPESWPFNTELLFCLFAPICNDFACSS